MVILIVDLCLYYLHYFIYFSSSEKEEEIEEYYRRKYADSSATERYGEGEEMSDDITQQGLLPGVK